MNTHHIQEKKQSVWVVFSGKADLPWLKILRPGFRHCFVLLNDGRHWISVDPLSNYTDIMVHHVPVEFDLPLWLADRGHAVVPAKAERPGKPAPWAVLTCVEAVKRIIGLHKRFIITPWQLYHHLLNTQSQKGEPVWEV